MAEGDRHGLAGNLTIKRKIQQGGSLSRVVVMEFPGKGDVPRQHQRPQFVPEILSANTRVIIAVDYRIRKIVYLRAQ